MTTRREISAALRAVYHTRRIREASTDAAELWATCTWLVAEARRAGRLAEVNRAVRGLVDRVRDGQPLPDQTHEPAAGQHAPRLRPDIRNDNPKGRVA